MNNDITLKFDSASYPQMNGQAEIGNGQILSILRKKLESKKALWADEIPLELMFTFRRTRTIISFEQQDIEACSLNKIDLSTLLICLIKRELKSSKDCSQTNKVLEDTKLGIDNHFISKQRLAVHCSFLLVSALKSYCDSITYSSYIELLETNHFRQATFIEEMSVALSLECIPLCATREEDSFYKFSQAWNGSGQTSLFIASRKYKLFSSELRNIGWRIVYVGADSNRASDDGNLNINKLEELPITICSLNKMEKHEKSVLMIGYVMKQSREEDFAKRGMLPMYPTHNGLLFVPLTFELPLAPQIKKVDVLLHKATDEIISIDTSLDFSEGISFSKGIRDLKRKIEDIPDCCVIDPLSNIYPLLDRLKIQEILCKLDGININGHCKLRAPYFFKVDNYDSSSLKYQLSEAKLTFPVIVKPRVACGIADAHNMAVVFKAEEFEGLSVPLPSVIQEFVDHGSSLFKFYVLGDKVFHAIKKSMPNSSLLLLLSGKSGSSPIIFNSLKSLPVAQEGKSSADCEKSNSYPIDMELVSHAAKCLREYLGLTIFGFDVVIQEGSGDHVIVDLNYLPSFKEIADSDAVPAFWDAIRNSYESWRASKLPAP